MGLSMLGSCRRVVDWEWVDLWGLIHRSQLLMEKMSEGAGEEDGGWRSGRGKELTLLSGWEEELLCLGEGDGKKIVGLHKDGKRKMKSLNKVNFAFYRVLLSDVW